MIDKERGTPARIMQNEALLRRLPPDHKKRQEIEEDQRKRKAGLKGEQSLDYHLSFISKEKYHIIHSFRLKNDNGYAFQIDTLIKSSSFDLILEVKNFSGTLRFEKHSNQFIRSINQEEEGFSNPLIQAQRHVVQYRNWLMKHKFPQLPIEYAVIISNPSTIIKTAEDNQRIFQNLFHAEHLPRKIAEYEKKYKNQLEHKDTRKIIRSILKHDEPLSEDIRKFTE